MPEIENTYSLITQLLDYLNRKYAPDELKQALAQRPRLLEMLRQLVNVEITPMPTPEPSALAPFSTQGNQVLYNGEEFRAIGFNLREAIGYGDIMQWATPALLRRQLEIVKAIGGKTVRFYAAHKDLPATEAARRTVNFLNLLKEFELFGIVVLDEGAHSDFRISKSLSNYTGRLTHRFYEIGYKEEYIPYAREVMQRVGNHPNVFCFEICNESTTPHPPDPTIAQMQAMLNWIKESSELIHEYAPEKLISPGWIAGWEMGAGNAYEGFKFTERVYGLEHIHLGCFHTYQGIRNLPLGDGEPNVKREMQIPNIPLYCGETGLEAGVNDWGWITRFANLLAPRCFMICQWALMGHDGEDLNEVRDNFDIGTGDVKSGMSQTYANGAPGVYWTEYVYQYKQLAKTLFK